MRYSFVADHFQYMAAPCLIALAAAGGHALWLRADARGARRARRAVVGAGVLVIACFAVLTMRQTRCYRDSETLWRDVLAKNPGAWIAHDNLAVILAARGENGAAGEHLRRSIGLKSDHAVSRANLGRVYLALGDARASEGELREAVRLDPDAAGAHQDLGRALAARGDRGGAARSFAEVVRLRPAEVWARRDLAVALAVDGQPDRAVEEFRAGLRIAGDSVECLNGLAWLLAVTPGRTASERSEAVGLAERAVALTGGRAPRTLDTLGAAYAAVGRFDRAVACGEAAVGLAAAAGDRALEAELRGRVEGYRAGRPFVEGAGGR
jgi:tetratricopeptide (TPR) repeat protein